MMKLVSNKVVIKFSAKQEKKSIVRFLFDLAGGMSSMQNCNWKMQKKWFNLQVK